MKCLIAVALVILLLIVVAICVSDTETISLEVQNMDIVQLSYIAFKEGDWTAFADLHSPVYIQHSPGFEDPITFGDYELSCRIVHKQLPDLQIRIVDIFAVQDKVAVRSIWEYRNNSRRFKCSYPDGVAQGSEIAIFRIEDSKIIEEWCEHDPAPVRRFCKVYKYLDHSE